MFIHSSDKLNCNDDSLTSCCETLTSCLTDCPRRLMPADREWLPHKAWGDARTLPGCQHVFGLLISLQIPLGCFSSSWPLFIYSHSKDIFTANTKSLQCILFQPWEISPGDLKEMNDNLMKETVHLYHLGTQRQICSHLSPAVLANTTKYCTWCRLPH